MELATGNFWDNFYREPREEWYFPMLSMLSLIRELFLSIPFPIVLHGGCGNSFLGESFLSEVKMQLIEFDISPLAFTQSNKCEDKSRLYPNLFLADMLSLPLENCCVDIVVEKGLFDSLTSMNSSARIHSSKMLSEYHRILRSQGFVIIFSIFGPASNKDTLGLLSHPNFTVECKNIFTSPAEIPTQDFCFVYILRKT